jgi:hypothetical protein
MSLSKIRSILSSPNEVIGVGERSPFKRKVNRFWPVGLALSAVLFASSASAHDVPLPVDNPFPAGQNVETVEMAKAPAGFQMYYQDLGSFVSHPGESKEKFMARVGSFLAYYTKVQGWEACGMVQESNAGDGWRVRLITNGSQLGCARIHFDTPGYTSTDESIHSHPSDGTAKVSRQDNLLQPYLMCGAYVRKQAHDFSEIDRRAGSGYLVTPAKMLTGPRLLFQDGGEAMLIAELETSPARPDDASFGIPVSEQGVVLVPLDQIPKNEYKVAGRSCKIS